MLKTFFTRLFALTVSLFLLWGAQPVFASEGSTFLTCPNAHPDLQSAYDAYQAEHPSFSSQQVVTLVNSGLNRPFYTEIEPVSDPDSLLVLVNKYHSLSETYVPSDLTQLQSGASGVQLRREAAEAFDRMAAAARAAGVNIIGVSGYRSYALQASLYQRYCAQDGTAAADRYSARPGHSEHQTGWAIDVSNGGVYTQFGGTAAHRWAVEHIHEYGFIIRYTKANEWITGYKDEAWHFRYVGIEAASEIYHLGITLEEYLDRYVLPTGTSTAALESLEQLAVQFSPVETGQPGAYQEVSATFSNVLVPVTGTLRWELNGIPVPGREQSDFTIENGSRLSLRYVQSAPNQTDELRLIFIGSNGMSRSFRVLHPGHTRSAFVTALGISTLPASPVSRQSQYQFWFSRGLLIS